MDKKEEDELESFRRQWLEEVRTRHPSAQPAQQAPGPGPGRAERKKSLPPQPQVQLPQEAADEIDEDSHVKVDTSELDGEFRALDLGVEEKAPQSALEHFEKAIEKEDQGRLGDSLNLYRKAYRLDAKVDQAYSKKHHASKPHAPAAAAATSTSTSNASTGEKIVISSFANLPIPPAEPIIENTPPPPCPISHLPSEVLIEILKDVALLDPALFARLSLVCKRLAYHVAHEQKIWRRLCQGHEFGLASMHYSFACEIDGTPLCPAPALDSDSDPQIVHSHPFTAQITASIPKPLTSWSHVFQAFPRLRFTGIYISTVNYTRPGANSAMHSVSWNTPIHIVTYYRYLHFYPDGTVLSLVTTTEPIEVVPHITRENVDVLTASAATKKHARHISDTPAPVPQTTSTANPMSPTAAATLKHTLRGRWRLTPPLSTSSSANPSSSSASPPPPTNHQRTDKDPAASSTPDPRDLFIETEGVGEKYMYTMHLSLRSVGSHKSKNTKLEWKGFWSYNRLTDDWAEFGLKNDRSFVFRRTQSEIPSFGTSVVYNSKLYHKFVHEDASYLTVPFTKKVITSVVSLPVNALQAWIGGRLCKPYWDEYVRGWVEPEQSKGRMVKLDEWRHVFRHLTDGESGGRRKFSEDFPNTSRWKAIDWQARLLWKLLSVNNADRHGPFYGKNLGEVEKASRTWQVILRLTLDEPHAPRRNKRAKVAGMFGDWQNEDKQTIPTNSENGAARIFWRNVPEELEDQGAKIKIILTDLVTYSYESFLEKIDVELELRKHGFRIDRLSFQLGLSENPISRDTFKEFHQHAATSKQRLSVSLTTAKALAESQIPDIQNEHTSRQLLYELMAAERVSKEKPDLTDRFWLWVALQQASDSRESPVKSDCEVTHEALNPAEECIRWLFKPKDSDEVGEETKNELLLHDLTDNDMLQYREQEKWLDNQDLQRQGHDEACKVLGIPNPSIPRLPGMPVSAKFEFWQPLAVKALKEFERGYLRGGILADEVGIGKTFEAIGLEQYDWNLRKAAIESKAEVEAPKPTLVVVPPNLIPQWSSTIKAVSTDLIVKIYYGKKQKEEANEVEYLGGILSRNHEVFAETEETARTVIITSFRTLNSRHGPTSLKKWILDTSSEREGSTRSTSEAATIAESEMAELTSPPDEWEYRLNGLFKRLIVDEAHEIRNKNTLTATTLRWLQAPAVLLLNPYMEWALRYDWTSLPTRATQRSLVQRLVE
ncbi:uncharacterized protein GIQ15_05716 [Arthroderma uncinatum]|uniref:uncharacterized protein n=1 Tax=Arthroderma uncinatum TaxID=74035 RepID=UPI00144A8310|nr:uncharacterized protein GIQ15_05716 [Arthroderma uncinatum]KAF3480369.1 hypothetical protein GIQ15_05716 [Arthroderma uncinatum]